MYQFKFNYHMFWHFFIFHFLKHTGMNPSIEMLRAECGRGMIISVLPHERNRFCMRTGTFPLSGVLVLHGGKTLLEDGAKILQSHTYAGSSALAYLTAIEILKEVPCWFSRAAALGCVVRGLALMI